MNDSSFYSERGLREPAEEYVAEDLGELEYLVTDPTEGRPRVILGGGEHVRDGVIADEEYEVVRTSRCDRILEVDDESNLVRLEAGVRWRQLRECLIEEGMTVQGYALQPDEATIGGLLGRHLGRTPARGEGALRGGCVALTAVSPTLGEYRYLRAPRKASGPDLRHLYIGGEGLLGVILEATIAAFKPFPSRLFEWPAPTAKDAVEVRRRLDERGVRPSWCHWSRSSGLFCAAMVAPTRLLEATVERLHAHFDEEVTVEDGEQTRERRRQLEAEHPGRRSRPEASATVELTFSLNDLGERVDAIDASAEVEILDWSPHAATAYVTFDEEEVPKLDESPTALAARRLVGGGPLDWLDWRRTLAEHFDAGGRLAPALPRTR